MGKDSIENWTREEVLVAYRRAVDNGWNLVAEMYHRELVRRGAI